jgi:hypothetical protein
MDERGPAERGLVGAGRSAEGAAGRDDVTASEAATYAFCAKAWHLEHVLGKPPSTAALGWRATGTARHDAHGAQVEEFRRVGPRLLLWSAALLVLAVMLLVFAVVAASH